jgi:cytochrome c556
MKCLAVALMLAALAVTGARADESCKDQVREESKFTAEMVKNFMTKCKDLATMVCSDRAIDQKVSDEAKDTFIKNCVKDEVGK